MKHTSQTQFGRANSAALDVLEEGPDKWTVLQLLTEASEAFDLSHRTLSVLKALLTFLPTRHIPAGPRAVVFPANRTLSHRLSGMPESTLRRHMARLVEVGIVSRQDSPNRKRFAKHRAGQVAIAYGFDLSPLAQMIGTLEVKAAEARDHRAALSVLRSHILDLRALVITAKGPSDLTDAAARILRRKPEEDPLNGMIELLAEALEDQKTDASVTEKLSVADDENERHIHKDSKYINTKAHQMLAPARTENKEISLSQVTERCTAFADYFPEKVTCWNDLLRISDRVAPMIGLEQETIDKARRILDRRSLCIVVLCILERFDKIENPSGYLHGLLRTAEKYKFRAEQFLMGSNMRNCQLTI